MSTAYQIPTLQEVMDKSKKRDQRAASGDIKYVVLFAKYSITYRALNEVRIAEEREAAGRLQASPEKAAYSTAVRNQSAYDRECDAAEGIEWKPLEGSLQKIMDKVYRREQRIKAGDTKAAALAAAVDAAREASDQVEASENEAANSRIEASPEYAAFSTASKNLTDYEAELDAAVTTQN